MAADVVGFVALLLPGLAVLFAVVFGVAILLLRGMARRKEAEARERYPEARRIDRTASFFGQESRGTAQMRGNGTLILTGSELVFEQWMTNREFRIPLDHIQAIEHPASFLGKSRLAPLLKVAYINELGASDSMAWQVSDLEGWARAIEEGRSSAL